MLRLLLILTVLYTQPDALGDVFETCRTDIVCRVVYPNLEARYDDLLEQIAETPVDYEDLTVTPELITQGLDGLARVAPGSVPAAIVAAENDDMFPILAGLSIPAQEESSQTVHFVVTAQAIQPAGMIGASVLGIFAAATLLYTTIKVGQYRRHFAWHVGFHRLHWLPFLASFVAIVGIALSAHSGSTADQVSRTVEIVIPLALALQAGMVFLPSTEPAVEVQLAAPRPIAWVAIERLLIAWGGQTIVALLGVGLLMFLQTDAPIGQVLFTWISPAFMLSGIAFAVTIHSGELTLAMVFTGLFWGVMLILSTQLLPPSPLQPALPFPFNFVSGVLWLIHTYLPPDALESDFYLINRIILLGIGCVFYSIALYRLRKPENII